jgi:hypothetical protein
MGPGAKRWARAKPITGGRLLETEQGFWRKERNNVDKTKLKRYSTRDAATATGLSESIFTSYASAHGKSSKEGWTILEINEVWNTPRRDRPVKMADEKMVSEIRAGLIPLGCVGLPED